MGKRRLDVGKALQQPPTLPLLKYKMKSWLSFTCRETRYCKNRPSTLMKTKQKTIKNSICYSLVCVSNLFF